MFAASGLPCPRCRDSPASSATWRSAPPRVLTWDRLSAISDDPWRDIEAGHVGDLADAELARLGLERPPLS